MKKLNRENDEATSREKRGEGATRKRRIQEIATNPKIVEDKHTKKKVEQRNMTEIKTGNTFGVLQDNDQEPILKEVTFLNYQNRKREKKNN